ncbi:ribokinase [Isoptericola cucumis]|uniref:Ribokinase n=1 Tax=Isoptericola cucumis TaxID=1776856 RepID=A0ABQ2B6T7_9MICO|nr:ribokinase [Isoptericola cucumis]GGI09270.1 ribokinase [Isoptericola cucumis]
MTSDGAHARRAGIVVVGSTNADLVLGVRAHPAPGETVLGHGMQVMSGGKGANQAVAAARLGAEVALVGAVGDDEFAVAALAGLRAAGVDLDAVAVADAPTGIAVVTVSDDGENSIVVVPGANGTVDADVVRAHEALVAGAAVVVLQGEIPVAGIEAAARAATGRLVVNLAPVVDVAEDVLLRADPLVLNEHEARLVGERLGVAAGRSDDEAALVRGLLARGVRSVVLTVGPRGALVGGADGGLVGGAAAVVRVPSPRVRAVDTTGAGDAFVGALACGLSRGDRLVDAARTAARVGAFAVRAEGAQASYPGVGDELPEVSEVAS